jgi:hypothetical protein
MSSDWDSVDILPVGAVLDFFMCLRMLCSHASLGNLFHRYSKRAKDLLARYELVPPARIIEVDLRGAWLVPFGMINGK